MAAKTSSSGSLSGQLPEADHPRLSDEILGEKALRMIYRELHLVVTAGIPALYEAHSPCHAADSNRHVEAGSPFSYLNRHLNHLRSLLFLPDSGSDYLALHFESDSNREEAHRPKV